jgi:hypothetical protein
MAWTSKDMLSSNKCDWRVDMDCGVFSDQVKNKSQCKFYKQRDVTGSTIL